MDKKKLIGTIIGVTLFAILVAGATFAWLTFGINVTNGTYNQATMNFSVDYDGGSEITAMPMLGTGTPSEASVITITANKSTGSAEGNLTLYLNTSSITDGEGIDITKNTSGTILSEGAIAYAICKGVCTDFNATIASGYVELPTLLADGSIPVEELDDGTEIIKVALNNSSDVNQIIPLEASATQYNIYFWLDSAKVGTDLIGQSFTGYISAEAIQVDTR